MRLLDKTLFVQSGEGRSPAFFCMADAIRVDGAMLEELIAVSFSRGGGNIRLCLHPDASAGFHEMVILEHRDLYYRPHLHQDKAESCHLIQGRMGVLGFGQEGAIQERYLLGEGAGILSRMEAGRWHTVVPLSPFVIYHETKPGPFLRNEDSVFAPWAPASTDRETEDYAAFLRRAAEEGSCGR